MKSLKEASSERKWNVSWEELDKRFATACKAADQSDYAEALKIQSKVIIDLMKQIRKERDNNNASDSAIDL